MIIVPHPGPTVVAVGSATATLVNDIIGKRKAAWHRMTKAPGICRGPFLWTVLGSNQ